MGNYDSIDADFTWDGDFTIGEDGDLGDTKRDLLLSFRNELHSIVKSELGDWQEDPSLGANVSDYQGEPNTRETAESLRNRIVTRIAAATIARSEDLTVRIVPVSVSQVLVILQVNAISTPGNNLQVGEPLVISLLYDSLEDSVFFMPPSKAEHDYRSA